MQLRELMSALLSGVALNNELVKNAIQGERLRSDATRGSQGHQGRSRNGRSSHGGQGHHADAFELVALRNLVSLGIKPRSVTSDQAPTNGW